MGKTKSIPDAKARSADATASSGGLTLSAYRGDGCVMLAFDLDKRPQNDFMGFAVKCTTPDKKSYWLKNRLTFNNPVTAATTPQQQAAQALGSNEAPFQKFRWVDFSSSREPGTYDYEVSAMYGKPGALAARETAALSLELGKFAKGDLEIGFTRGFLSSQAYVDEFKNASIRPEPKTLDYDTEPYRLQYEWLGYHAREILFRFLNDCLADKGSTLDMLAYDLDEPDILKKLEAFGPRLRAVLDDSPLHVKAGALEIEAKRCLAASAGGDHVVSGHFKRFAHCKVFIQRKNGQAVRVAAGSANFSVRGLYVQANNVLLFNDAATAHLYGESFDQTFHDMRSFATSEIAEGWSELSEWAVCFSPHRDAGTSLARVAEAIGNAQSSVFFAIMELGGSGPVMQAIKDLQGKRPDIFTYGVTQSLGATNVYKPGSGQSVVTPFSYLKDHVPEPFNKEISGGMGQVIHDKFIVIDFNAQNPKVYTGSSNLAAGGEESNGDSLVELHDPDVARLYAVNAVGLFDHFHFRAAQQGADVTSPLKLDDTGAWLIDYYKTDSIHYRDRRLFC